MLNECDNCELVIDVEKGDAVCGICIAIVSELRRFHLNAMNGMKLWCYLCAEKSNELHSRVGAGRWAVSGRRGMVVVRIQIKS